MVGIAGVNTRPLHSATLGIAGNLSSSLRPPLTRGADTVQRPTGTRLGDQAASRCWARASYLLDYTYLTCPSRVTGALRYRSGFRVLCAPESRSLPLFLDSGAYRESANTAPSWSSYPRYCQAIDLVRPDGAMAKDVLNDQARSYEGYRRLCSDGYQQTVIPVWQAQPGWESSCDAATNGRLASRDVTLRSNADRSPMVAIGGLVRGPCPRTARHLYLAELVAAFPDTHFCARGGTGSVKTHRRPPAGARSARGAR